MLFRFLRRWGFLRLFRLRFLAGASSHIFGAQLTFHIHRTGGAFFLTGADGGRFFLGLLILQQRLEICVIHLVQKVDGSFLILVGPVDEDVK